MWDFRVLHFRGEHGLKNGHYGPNFPIRDRGQGFRFGEHRLSGLGLRVRDLGGLPGSKARNASTRKAKRVKMPVEMYLIVTTRRRKVDPRVT